MTHSSFHYIGLFFISLLLFSCQNQEVKHLSGAEEKGRPVLTKDVQPVMIDTLDEDTLVEKKIREQREFNTIAFGSCNKHDLPQPLWGPILSHRPNLWIWLGDNIYGDSADSQVMKMKYDKQKENIGYQKLTKTCPIIGTWDDHDYGKNDGNKYFEGKEGNKEALLDFLNVPQDVPVRKRPGIYQTYTFGTGRKKIKVIILDTRTFRDPCVRTKDKKKEYIPNLEGDILGEEQWRWFEKELKNNDAAITLVVNGTQVISKEHRFEKWANYPGSRKRLFKAIKNLRPSGVILLSGDRHHGEISRVNIPDMAHPLYEFTSSGLTHTRKYDIPEANRYRVGKKISSLNYGLMKINWDASPVEVTLEIRGEKDVLHESTTFKVLEEE